MRLAASEDGRGPDRAPRVVGRAAAVGNAWAILTRGDSGLPEAREAEHAQACQAKHGSAPFQIR